MWAPVPEQFYPVKGSSLEPPEPFAVFLEGLRDIWSESLRAEVVRFGRREDKRGGHSDIEVAVFEQRLRVLGDVRLVDASERPQSGQLDERFRLLDHFSRERRDVAAGGVGDLPRCRRWRER